MDNENKDFQGVENEETLTPEEKVQEDIRSKVADAAAEIQDEITPAAEDAAEEIVGETIEGAEGFEQPAGYYDENGEFVPYGEGEFPEGYMVPAPEPVKVTLKRSSLIVSLICSAVIGALLLLVGLQVPKWIDAIPEGNTIATVNGESITDLDVQYYIYAQAATYAQNNGVSADGLAEYDWNQEVDGKVLANTIKEKALNDAINEVLLIQKGEENDVTLSDDELAQIDSQVSGILTAYGEDGFALRARTMGIASTKQYKKMYTKVMTAQTVQEDMSENRSAYYPEDESILNDYIQPDYASVKHILIKNTTPATPAEGDEAPAPAEDTKAKAEEILARAQSGEDFDALVEEFNEDPGATEEGYTFGPGEMDPAFEAASFALKIGEISDLVESAHGYHIIKRIPGITELEAYWRENDAKVKIKTRKLDKLDVAAIMSDVIAANDELEAETAAAQAGAAK